MAKRITKAEKAIDDAIALLRTTSYCWQDSTRFGEIEEFLKKFNELQMPALLKKRIAATEDGQNWIASYGTSAFSAINYTILTLVTQTEPKEMEHFNIHDMVDSLFYLTLIGGALVHLAQMKFPKETLTPELIASATGLDSIYIEQLLKPSKKLKKISGIEDAIVSLSTAAMIVSGHNPV